MVAEMTWREMVGWRAFYQIEPFGEKRADLRIGYAMARLAAYMGGKGVRVEDFIVSDDGAEEALRTKPSFAEVRGALFGLEQAPPEPVAVGEPVAD